eukprot:5500626-Lingulodinium_polyedra.AAC.1
MERARGWRLGFAKRTASRCLETRATSYWVAGREAFDPARVAILSVALDGTRMSGKDTLYVALYSPELQRALWCPPQ